MAPGRSARAQQQEVVVEALAHILAAEDARTYDGTLFRTAARNPEAIVRRHVALAIGRIGDAAGIAMLQELLADSDSMVATAASFALGLLREASAIPRLRAAVLEPAPGAPELPRAEAVSAIARIGGRGAEQFFGDVLIRSGSLASSPNVPPFLRQALADAWLLGAAAPVARIIPFASSPDTAARRRAIYSLARLGDPSAADVLLAATDDSIPLIRATAVRELTADFADTAGIDPRALTTRVRRLTADPDRLVRIAALRALGTYGSPELASAAVDRLSDPDQNVRVQALTTLGELGGPAAAKVLVERVGNGPFALRREALLSLAETSPLDAVERAKTWLADPDWRVRASATEALGFAAADSAFSVLDGLLGSPDARIASAAFSALAMADGDRARIAARSLLTHPDPQLRSLAALEIASSPRPSDLPLLIDGYARSLGDLVPDARISMMSAVGRLAERHPLGRVAVTDSFARRFPKGKDYLVRRAAAHSFPSLAARWGAAMPAETGLDLGDYRDIARRLVWPAERGVALPGLVIETDRGTIDLDLFAGDAPLTINALLRLVERRYFDGGSWHRVIPGFVAQDGDPRGDGSGGPGFVLRDELSPLRFDAGTMGIALDGPDTGGSQFFITLAPQPHLDGGYTVIGRVHSGMDVLAQVLQGDRIRRIRLR